MSAGVGTAKVRALHFPLSHSFPHTSLKSPCVEQPRATRVGDSIVLVGGRPGNIAWLNPTGDGAETWIKQEMPAPATCEVKLTKKICNTCTCTLVRHIKPWPSHSELASKLRWVSVVLRHSMFVRLTPTLSFCTGEHVRMLGGQRRRHDVDPKLPWYL